MNFYNKNDVQNIESYTFDFIELDENDHVFTITLNRPDKKNALHPQMMNEIAFVSPYMIGFKDPFRGICCIPIFYTR